MHIIRSFVTMTLLAVGISLSIAQERATGIFIGQGLPFHRICWNSKFSRPSLVGSVKSCLSTAHLREQRRLPTARTARWDGGELVNSWEEKVEAKTTRFKDSFLDIMPSSFRLVSEGTADGKTI
jgi:hypothetical protein